MIFVSQFFSIVFECVCENTIYIIKNLEPHNEIRRNLMMDSKKKKKKFDNIIMNNENQNTVVKSELESRAFHEEDPHNLTENGKISCF